MSTHDDAEDASRLLIRRLDVWGGQMLKLF